VEEQRSLPKQGSDRLRAFFEYWTLKEAHLKAVGLGLSYPIARIQIGHGPTPFLKRCAKVDGLSGNDWTVNVWCLGDDAIAAACVGQADSLFTIQPFPLAGDLLDTWRLDKT
jgi:4'-phosphopantetheinyl transferase